MENNVIVEQILLKLDGWKLDTEVSQQHLMDSQFNKSISSEEVLHFYSVAKDYAMAYVGVSTEIELMQIISVQTALILWSAGLIWRKYNVRSNDQIDETMTIGYGDSLIIQAKEMLKPSKNYNLYAY